MALTNWDIINIVNTVVNKDLNGEAVRPDEFQSLINAQSKLLFAEKLGIPNEYQLNAPIARNGAEISKKAKQELMPFYVRETANAVGGSLDLSSKNIGYLLAIEPATLTGRGFDELDSYEVADRLSSSVVAPTEKDPALEWNTSGNGVLLYPSTISSVVLKYYKNPTDAVVAITANATTLQPEYDSGNSAETGWDDEQQVEIAYRILQDLGINMERADVVQYATKVTEND